LIIDTDVLIWYLRGNEKARDIVENNVPFSISVITYMELIQGMKNKDEFKLFQKQIQKWNTDIIQIDKEISSRSMFYVQEYALSHSMMLADALIAATTVQNNDVLITANDKHYKFIPNIECKKFLPGDKKEY
jgi:predicted nucleic acid-binding protein